MVIPKYSKSEETSTPSMILSLTSGKSASSLRLVWRSVECVRLLSAMMYAPCTLWLGARSLLQPVTCPAQFVKKWHLSYRTKTNPVLTCILDTCPGILLNDSVNGFGGYARLRG